MHLHLLFLNDEVKFKSFVFWIENALGPYQIAFPGPSDVFIYLVVWIYFLM